MDRFTVFLLMGEKVKSSASAIGRRSCPVCKSEQNFTEQTESLWFSLFGISILPLEQRAHYHRCENCLSAYKPGRLEHPSSIPLVKDVIVYLLLGYDQQEQVDLASEVCAKLTGFEFTESEVRELCREIASGQLNVAELVRRQASSLNHIGKQQVLEAAFLTTYACCDIEYEDRLRINQIGSALDVGLEFVTYAIDESRRQQNYGIRRLPNTRAEV